MAKKKDAETSAEAPAEKMTQREAVENAIAVGKDLPAEGVLRAERVRDHAEQPRVLNG